MLNHHEALKRGENAHSLGVKLKQNPYEDIFQRAAWEAGWDKAAKNNKKRGGMKKITEERKEELKKWVYLMWQKWDKSLTPPSDSRSLFLKYVTRDNPDDDQLKKIELALEAQVKYWRLKRNADGRVIGACNLSTWYNTGRYEDEFIEESFSDIRQRIEGKTCTHEGCDNPVHGEKFEVCTDHIPNTCKLITKQTHLQALKALNLLPKAKDSESLKEWRMACKKWIKERSGIPAVKSFEDL